MLPFDENFLSPDAIQDFSFKRDLLSEFVYAGVLRLFSNLFVAPDDQSNFVIPGFDDPGIVMS